MVGVRRLYWHTGSDTAYVESYFSERSTVGAWRESRTLKIDDDGWREKIARTQRIFAAAGDPFTVDRIDDDVEVSFTVPVNQKDPRFGSRNEKLTGSKVETGRLRVVREEVAVKLPFGMTEDEVNVETPIHAYNMEIGKSYRIEIERVPLMPSRQSLDLEDLDRVQQLRGRMAFDVLDRDESGIVPWYRVRVTTDVDREAVEGWVNSTALLQAEIWTEGVHEAGAVDSYRELSIDDVSYANVKRYTVKIEIPIGRTRDQVESTLRRAASTVYERKRRPSALSVFAYMPGDDHEGAYTVGKVDYAPNGRWEDAGKRGQMRYRFDIGDAYEEISRLVSEFQAGTTVRLKAPVLGDGVSLFRDSDGWEMVRELGSLPDDSIGEIVEAKFVTIGANDVMGSIRISTERRGRRVLGWVRMNHVEVVP